MNKTFFTLSTIVLLLTTSCTKDIEIVQKEKIERFISVEISEDEILDLNSEKPTPEFTKYAKSESKNKATIVAQSTGEVIELNFQMGEKVIKNQQIAKIGNSLSGDINQSQINSAENSLNIAEKSKENTVNLSKIGKTSAEIALNTAKESLNNAKTQYKNAENIYDIQYENAEKTYKTARNNYYDAKDALENFKLNNFEEEKIEEMEAQVNALKSAYKQSKYALEQMEESEKAQNDQLKFAIEMAENQYKLAEEQYKSSIISSSSQILGQESQILQIKSSKELLEINKKYNSIKTPISGIISELFVDKNSFVAQGQQIAKIEDPSEIILKTQLNETEISLIKLYDTVEVLFEDRIISGKINNIQKNLDPQTGKADIEISLPKESGIISGKLIKTVFKTKTEEKIYIPINALSIKDKKNIVKTINEKSFIELKEVETGEIFGSLIEIKAGLSGNEKVLTKGNAFIEKNYKVLISKS